MVLLIAMKENVEQKEKVAAGGVVIDGLDKSLRVLVVHRPRHDDWSFPKGGVNAGESIEEAAVREVEEETGLRCRIIKRLASTRYPYPTRKGPLRPKVVHYFLMEREAGHLASDGEEVDCARWLGTGEAARLLSYEVDRQLLETLEPGD